MAAAPVTVTIEQQSRYAAGAPIPLTVVVTNTSAAPVLVNSRLLKSFEVADGDLYLTVKSEDGKKLEFQAFVTPRQLADRDFVVLDPGKTIKAKVDLKEDYGVGGKGTYDVVATYRNKKPWTKDNLQAWVGNASSKPVQVKVD